MVAHRNRVTRKQTLHNVRSSESRNGSKFRAVPFGLLALGLSSDVFAAAEIEASSVMLWTTLIILIVFAATAGSAVLNIAAIRQWDRNWGLVSGLPLVGLLVWSLLIFIAKFVDPETHALWTLEIFAWAMINMVYMVTAMTAKRMFAKRDEENSTTP